MTKPLSPATDDVADAAHAAWVTKDAPSPIAAAIRAAVEQVLPHEDEPPNAFEEEGYVPGRLREERQRIRKKFLTIVQELENANG